MAVVVTSDWKLEEVAGRTYGMCRASWSEPFDRFDYERGFALPNPTNIRVAAQALIWALESVEGCDWLNRDEDTIIVSTKHKWLCEILTSPDRAPRWIRNGSWPKTQSGVKTLISKCHSLMEKLNRSKEDFVNLVYIEREEEDRATVDLDEHRTAEGFDMEGFVKKGAPKAEIEKALQETRMRGVMAQKLMTSGARCYRTKKL